MAAVIHSQTDHPFLSANRSGYRKTTGLALTIGPPRTMAEARSMQADSVETIRSSSSSRPSHTNASWIGQQSGTSLSKPRQDAHRIISLPWDWTGKFAADVGLVRA